jgi:hypothetical protein
MRRFVASSVALATALVGSIGVASAAPGPNSSSPRRGGEFFVRGHAVKSTSRTSGSNGISYHGGAVMLSNPNIYVIWYGNWSGNTATTIVPNFLGSLGGSPYEHINSTYYSNAGHVTGGVTYAGSTTVAYPYGTALSDSNVQSIVSDAITSKALPSDTNGVYFVLTSADVNETSGLDTKYCGWHSHGSIGGSDIKYAFVGNPDRSPSACAAQTSSPNGNAGADAMLSIVAHEQEEAISDPDLNAWFDRQGNENADKCAWTFGTQSTASNGSKYNVTLGGNQYLIQQNWVNASGGYCSMSY